MPKDVQHLSSLDHDGVEEQDLHFKSKQWAASQCTFFLPSSHYVGNILQAQKGSFQSTEEHSRGT